MADTPRVTVPVEDLLFYKLKDLILDQSEGEWTDEMIVRDAHHFANHIRPLLSAAPAPEGGAKHYGDPCVKCGVGHDDVPPGPCRGDGITISRERANALLGYLKNGRGPAGWPTTLWCEVQAFIANIEAALATRSDGKPEGGAVILKGVGKIDGDGWKDTTRKGEVVFVWNIEKPPPYAPGQYPRIGNEGWSASTSQYDFTPATAQEVRDLFAALATREEAPAEMTDCKTCAGNGEIVTDWGRYLGPHEPGDQGDEGTADCPDCDGMGKVEAPAEAGTDDIQRTASGETVLGFKVAAWQYLGPSDDGDAKYGHRYCEHWSTVGNHPKKVVRLFTEDQLRAALRAQPPAREDAQPVLTVWYGSMPESNGRQNWTAILGRKGDGGFDMHIDGFCFARSEYPDRVRYEADEMRWTIGELAEKPDILAYDADLHSGYVAPTPAPDALRVAVEALTEVSSLTDKDVSAKGLLGAIELLVEIQTTARQALAALQAEQGAK